MRTGEHHTIYTYERDVIQFGCSRRFRSVSMSDLSIAKAAAITSQSSGGPNNSSELLDKQQFGLMRTSLFS